MTIDNTPTPHNNLNFAAEIIHAGKTGQKKVADIIANMNISQVNDHNIIIAAVEGFALENQGFLGQNSYLEAFNKARASELYKGEAVSQGEVDRLYKPVQMMTREEKEIFQAEVKRTESEVKRTESFAQSANDTGGSLTQISSLVETTLLPAMTRYFYDSPVLKLANVLPYGRDRVEVRDIINDRLAEAIGETTALTTTTATDDTVVVDTLDPKKIRIVDNKTITWLLNELEDPTLAGKMFGRMERAVRRRVEMLVFGSLATDTDGANQFYSILNNKASSGTNRGSLAVTVNGVGIGGVAANANHVEAINYVVSQMPLDGDVSVGQVVVCCNFATKMKIMRTLDGNNNYYFDMVTGETRALASGIQIVVIPSLANDLVVVADLSGVVLKFLRQPKLTTRIVDDNYIRLTYDTYGDGTISFAYKATPTKNGFRHFTLQSNYLV